VIGRSAALGVAAVLCLGCGPAFGHGLDPAFLSLRDAGNGVFDVTWRTAAQRLPGANVQPLLPTRCRQLGPSNTEVGSDQVTLRWSVDCGREGLTGETIGVQDLDAAKINALLRVEEAGRPTVQVILNPSRASYTVPAQPSSFDVVRDFAALGVEHILTGPDHLLFVFGLLLLAHGGAALRKTVTAFTLGHSVTLSVAALGIAAVPSRPIELLIALSVLALAVDLAGADDRTTTLRRFPWLMAAGFGLLHGFGFAGALAETGLPAGEIPLALLSFNVGIEIGQLCFVAVLLLAGVAARRAVPATARMRNAAVYAMGVLAAFWSIERAVEWLG